MRGCGAQRGRAEEGCVHSQGPRWGKHVGASFTPASLVVPSLLNGGHSELQGAASVSIGSAVGRKAGEQRKDGAAGHGDANHVWGGRPGGVERPASLVPGPTEPEEVVPAGGGGPLPTADGRLAPGWRMLPGGADAKPNDDDQRWGLGLCACEGGGGVFFTDRVDRFLLVTRCVVFGVFLTFKY